MSLDEQMEWTVNAIESLLPGEMVIIESRTEDDGETLLDIQCLDEPDD